MKKLYIILASICFYVQTFADAIDADPMGLPSFGSKGWISFKEKPHSFISKTIAEWIKYVWLLAIIAIVYWWIMYITSIWDDNKIKKAKQIIEYSIIWILASMFAFAIIEIVNNIKL